MTAIDTIAATIHETWRDLSRAEGQAMPAHLDRPFVSLAEADKDNNRAAARRMTAVLAVAGLTMTGDVTQPAAAVETALEQMAEAEHEGWMAHRAAHGWTHGVTRDDNAKKHPSMVPYAELPETEKEKDRNNVRHYPEFAARAGLRIVAIA